MNNILKFEIRGGNKKLLKHVEEPFCVWRLASLQRYMYIFVKALVMPSKRSCNLLVFVGIEYCYLLMRARRLAVEANIYQKTDRHTHPLFFIIAAEKTELCTSSL